MLYELISRGTTEGRAARAGALAEKVAGDVRRTRPDRGLPAERCPLLHPPSARRGCRKEGIAETGAFTRAAAAIVLECCPKVSIAVQYFESQVGRMSAGR